MTASCNTLIQKPLQIVSYNLHGLNQGRSLLTELYNSTAPPEIIFIQQHWQTPSIIDKIMCFSQNYVGFGIFAMERVVTLSISKCWPHCGVSILINKSLGKLCKIRLILATEIAVNYILRQYSICYSVFFSRLAFHHSSCREHARRNNWSTE